MRILLYIIAIILDIITKIRNLFFDWSIFPSRGYKTPIICIGNLSVGGTGKTPLTDYIIHLLKKEYKVAVLSRGYGRKKQDFRYVSYNSKVKEVGDEPLMLKKKHPNIIIAVDSNKRRGVKKIIQDNNISIILLDDGFQHRWIKAGMNILLTKYELPFYNDYLYPFGKLRENKNGAKRSDIIIITKCPNTINPITKKGMIEKLNINYHQKVYLSKIEYEDGTGLKRINNSIKKYSIILVTGIEDATPLINYLNQENYKINHLKYSDHHNYTEKDCQNILDTYHKESNINKIILTTDKDKVKLEEFNAIFEPVKIHHISIKTNIEMEAEFKKQIIDYVRKNTSNN